LPLGIGNQTNEEAENVHTGSMLHSMAYHIIFTIACHNMLQYFLFWHEFKRLLQMHTLLLVFVWSQMSGRPIGTILHSLCNECYKWGRQPLLPWTTWKSIEKSLQSGQILPSFEHQKANNLPVSGGL